METIKWCAHHNRNKLTIFCDNEQVINQKNEFYRIAQKKLKESMSPYKSVKFKFKKVTAHKGNKLNQQAHELANEARKSIE
ncbi:hypothetical protein JK180_15875 [Lactiplantibacillus plantarum]|nr:hypothetical protein [Lactiplantibacillus plantarum]